MKNVRKAAALLLTLVFLFALAVPAFAADEVIIPIYLDGERVDFGETNGKQDNAIILHDYAYVPIARIVEILTGSRPDWDDATRTVSFSFNGTDYAICVDESGVYVDGKFVESETPIELVNDRTLIPLKVLTGVMGFEQRYDEKERATYLTSPGSSANRKPSAQSVGDLEGTRLMAVISLLEGDTYHYEMEFFGLKIVIYRKGDMMCFDMGELMGKMVMRDGYAYMFDADEEVYIVSAVDAADLEEMMFIDPTDLYSELLELDITFIGTGTAMFNGKNLYYEDFEANDVTTRFFFDGNSLAGYEEEGREVILIITDKVPDSVFDVLDYPHVEK